MSAIKDGGPAFPRTAFETDLHEKSRFDTMPQDGMTLRDYFAAKAMQALRANEAWDAWSNQGVAHASYALADNMLAARKVIHD